MCTFLMSFQEYVHTERISALYYVVGQIIRLSNVQKQTLENNFTWCEFKYSLEIISKSFLSSLMLAAQQI